MRTTADMIFMRSRLAPFALCLALAACAQYSADPRGGDAASPTDGGPPVGTDGPVVIGDAGTPSTRSCTTTFSYNPGKSVTSVAVAGEWNMWDPKMAAMTGPDSGGVYTLATTLQPGAWAYKFVVDGTDWQLDPANSYSKYVNGTENSLVEVDDCKNPLLQFLKLDSTPDGNLSAQVQYVDGSGAAGLDSAKLSVLLDGQPAPGTTLTSAGLISIVTTGLGKDKHRLTVRASDLAGHAAEDLLVPFWIEDQPFDFRDGLLYFVFTDRFRDGDTSNNMSVSGIDARANYEGGDYAGVQAALDSGYFDSLGVRTIWLSPPNQNPNDGGIGIGGYLYSGYHGYWPTAGTDVQSRFGGLPALKSLVAAAHKRGIRIIVDTVLNHVHQEHTYYVMHKEDGWFNGDGTCICGAANCDWTTHALDCWFEPYLPDINYANFDAMKAMIDDALYWAREADVDGFRVDAVKHFLHAATRRLRSKLQDQLEHVGPLYYLVGETFDGDRGLIDSFIGPHELNAQFDFPVYFAVRDTLASYSASLRELEGAVNDSHTAFGTAPMSPFLGNHDVPRFLTQAAGQLTNDPNGEAWTAPPPAPSDESAYIKLRLALTFVATQPGVPLIYYGDEYGQPGAADPDNRRFMKWSGYSPFEQATLELAQKLGSARAGLLALQRGDQRTLYIDDNVYVYARTSGTAAAVVAINRDWTAHPQSVPIPSGIPIADGTVLHDRLGGPDVTAASGQLSLTLPPHSSAVLAP
jgi:glycosidase